MKNNDTDRLTVPRVLVALDASGRSREIIESAARLAAVFKAELVGMFVEDADLVSMTRLPFVREVSFFSSALRKIELHELERQFRAQAEWMRRELAAVAEREQLSWRFRVVRGAIADELLAAAAENDLLILSKVGRPLFKKMGSTTQMLILQRPGLTLVIQEGKPFSSPLVLIYDGSITAEKAFEMAIRLTQWGGGRIHVVTLAEDDAHARELKQEVIEKLEKQGKSAHVRSMINPSAEKLAAVIRMESAGPVVIPCGEQNPLQGKALCSLVGNISNPVLIMR